MKRIEDFWSYRLHKLGTPKVLRTGGQTDGMTDGHTDAGSGSTTRHAFAKATHVKIPQSTQHYYLCLAQGHGAVLSSLEQATIRPQV